MSSFISLSGGSTSVLTRFRIGLGSSACCQPWPSHAHNNQKSFYFPKQDTSQISCPLYVPAAHSPHHHTAHIPQPLTPLSLRAEGMAQSCSLSWCNPDESLQAQLCTRDWFSSCHPCIAPVLKFGWLIHENLFGSWNTSATAAFVARQTSRPRYCFRRGALLPAARALCCGQAAAIRGRTAQHHRSCSCVCIPVSPLPANNCTDKKTPFRVTGFKFPIAQLVGVSKNHQWDNGLTLKKGNV